MKKMSEIMDELGFRPEGSDEVKKAFIKNLIKQAHASEYQRPQIKTQPTEKKKSKEDLPKQISLFDQKLSS
jgi:hypothetical protein